MTDLIPFTTPAPLRVQANLTTGAPEWHLGFRIQDPDKVVLDSLRAGTWPSWERADELWKTTCLEAFWGIAGDPAYWELNLSPSRQLWNLYRFENYREPQPPARSYDFELKDIIATRETLDCVLKPKMELSNVEFSLTAIIRTQNRTHYFATKHAGPKADFHLRQSFAR